MKSNRSSWRTAGWVIGALAIIVLFSTAAMLGARHTKHSGWAMPLTGIASTGYLLIAMAGGARHLWYGRFLGLGLAGCWIGDIAGPGNFIAGAVAFLLGHVAFIAAFAAQGIARRRLFAGLLLLPVSAGLAAWLLPHVPPGEQKTIAAYLLTISAMVVMAVGASGAPGGHVALMGAILFFISDIFVARWRYVTPGPSNIFLCYPMYYLACITLAVSIWAARRPCGEMP